MASANCYGSLEGLLWVEPLLVSNSGLDKRFCKIPAALFTQLLSQVQQQLATRPSGAELSEPWQALQQRFSAIWLPMAQRLRPGGDCVAATVGANFDGNGVSGTVHSRARLRDDTTELIDCYQQHAKLLGLVKARRKRQRQKDALWTEIGGMSQDVATLSQLEILKLTPMLLCLPSANCP